MKKVQASRSLVLFFSTLSVLIGMTVLIQVGTRAAVTDYAPKQLLSVPQPLKGQTYIDPAFGTKVLRVTDANDATIPTVAYSYWPTFNNNSTKFMIALDNIPYLYNFDPASLAFQKLGPLFSSGRQEMIWEGMTWSATDPNIVYGISGYLSNVKLRGYNVSTKQYVFEHDFSVSGELPGGIPWQMSKARSNDRYFSFHWKAGEGQPIKYAVVYDKQLNKTYLYNLLDATSGIPDFNECRLDRNGNYLAIWTGQDSFIWQFATQTQDQRVRLVSGFADRSGGHYELGAGMLVNADIWGNNGNRVIQRSLTTPHTWIQTFDSGVTDWTVDHHFSMLGPDDTWVLVSTTNSPPNYSLPFSNEIFLVKTDGSGNVQRLVQHRSSNSSYAVLAFANLSPDGRFVAYNSDWGGGHLDVYIAVVPPGLWSTGTVGTPTANITATPTTGTAPLVVNFSSTGSSSPNGALTYNWNFGDGTSATTASASHTYSTAGSYTATLTVTDPLNKTASANATITVSAPVGNPVAKVTATPTTGTAPLVVTLSSTGSSSPNGALTYSWNFGDGTTGTGVSATYTYSVAGNYTANLTVTDPLGKTASAGVTITVSAPVGNPVAKVTATPTTGTAPLAVSFSSTGSSSPNGALTYSWNFGDGTSTTTASPSHTYSGAGSYTANLTVTDPLGKTASAAVIITVSAPVGNPVAKVTATPTTGTAPLAVSFSSTGSSSPNGALTYNWNFGDGTTGTGASATHTYSVAGNYTANLTVTDPLGKTASADAVITVASTTPTTTTTISFRNGDGKTTSNTFDTSVYAKNPNYTVATNSNSPVGGSTGALTLIAMPGIIGTGANQIPPGATIKSATLTMTIGYSVATELSISRILDPNNFGMWDTSSTTSGNNVGVNYSYRNGKSTIKKRWSNTASNLLQNLAAADSTITLKGSESIGTGLTFDVTRTVAAWAAGEPNQGWTISSTTSTSSMLVLYDSGYVTTSYRPVLTVTYTK